MGHVFHPGHEALHGVTVVVTGASGRHYVGRYHETTERGVVLHDACVHEPNAAGNVRDWVARQRKFGVRADVKFLVIPVDESEQIVRLAEWQE